MFMFKLTMIIMLSHNHVVFPDETYHDTLQECKEAATQIASAYRLKEGAKKIYAECSQIMES